MDITDPSRFLADIPKELMKIQSQSPRSFTSSRNRDGAWGEPREQASSFLWQTQSPTKTQKLAELKYIANMRVSHPNWGEGWILESKIMDGDEVVDVSFDSVGLKRLLASLAGLTVIEKK
jgi:DNA helicase-2/ATP-dependent DNA helicase PcrA